MIATADNWIPALDAAALPAKGAVRAWAGGVRIVAGRRPDGRPFAALDSCPHLDLPLAAFGKVDVKGERIICPWHLWEFDVRTGRCEYASLYADDEMFFFQREGKDQPLGEAAGYLRRLPARLCDGRVEVSLPSDPAALAALRALRGVQTGREE